MGDPLAAASVPADPDTHSSSGSAPDETYSAASDNDPVGSSENDSRASSESLANAALSTTSTRYLLGYPANKKFDLEEHEILISSLIHMRNGADFVFDIENTTPGELGRARNAMLGMKRGDLHLSSFYRLLRIPQRDISKVQTHRPKPDRKPVAINSTYKSQVLQVAGALILGGARLGYAVSTHNQESYRGIIKTLLDEEKMYKLLGEQNYHYYTYVANHGQEIMIIGTCIGIVRLMKQGFSKTEISRRVRLYTMFTDSAFQQAIFTLGLIVIKMHYPALKEQLSQNAGAPVNATSGEKSQDGTTVSLFDGLVYTLRAAVFAGTAFLVSGAAFLGDAKMRAAHRVGLQFEDSKEEFEFDEIVNDIWDILFYMKDTDKTLFEDYQK